MLYFYGFHMFFAVCLFALIGNLATRKKIEAERARLIRLLIVSRGNRRGH